MGPSNTWPFTSGSRSIRLPLLLYGQVKGGPAAKKQRLQANAPRPALDVALSSMMTKPPTSSDLEPGSCFAAVACRSACPAGTDVEALVCLLARGRHLDAYRAARASNPFTGLCGELCPAPCEQACIRSGLDASVSIRALERFVNQLYGAISPSAPGLTFPPRRSHLQFPGRPLVHVSGGGPMALSCAHDLVQMGARVTLSTGDQPAGDVSGIIGDILRAEADAVIDMGVEVVEDKSALVSAPDYEVQAEYSGSLDDVAAAVAFGKKLARQAYQALSGNRIHSVWTASLSTCRPDAHLPNQQDLRRPRQQQPVVNNGSGTVELCYSEPCAAAEARRCLACSVRLVTDTEEHARVGAPPEATFGLDECRQRGLTPKHPRRGSARLMQVEYAVDNVASGDGPTSPPGADAAPSALNAG